MECCELLCHRASERERNRPPAVIEIVKLDLTPHLTSHTLSALSRGCVSTTAHTTNGALLLDTVTTEYAGVSTWQPLFVVMERSVDSSRCIDGIRVKKTARKMHPGFN